MDNQYQVVVSDPTLLGHTLLVNVFFYGVIKIKQKHALKMFNHGTTVLDKE